MERMSTISDGPLNISDVLDVIEASDPSFAEQQHQQQHQHQQQPQPHQQLQQQQPQPHQLQQQQQPQQHHRPEVEMIGMAFGPIGANGGGGNGGGNRLHELRPPTASTSSAQIHNGPVPYVEIVEQPASKALRFRYECEGRSAGSIPGVNSTPENRTFPAIRIVGYKGRAIVVVSCVTKEMPHRPHPHNLVGREVCKKGVCTLEVASDNMIVTFDKLGIQCVKKKEVEDALKVREELRVDPFRTGFEHKRHGANIDLNAVRLCFQVFLEGPNSGDFRIPLKPIVSQPIYDKKAMSDLVICKLSHCAASVAGGLNMILLCEKVAKEDIQVRFYEQSKGQIIWEAYGEFQPVQVHKQVAIHFQTPRYRNQQVDHVVHVYVQLRRPSDSATSEPLPFQLLPLGRPSHLQALRKTFLRKKAASELAAELSGAEQLAALYEDARLSVRGGSGGGIRATHQLGSERDLENGFADDDRTIVPERNDSESRTPLMTRPIVGQTQPKSDWFDYSEVGKWVQNVQESIRAGNNNDGFIAGTAPATAVVTATNGNGSINEILDQVVEIDKIYEDTHAKIMQEQEQQQSQQLQQLPVGTNILADQVQENGNLMEIDVPDNQTYTSLQMAMKNPVLVRSIKPDEPTSDMSVSGIHASSPIISIAPDAAPPPRPPPLASRSKRDVVVDGDGQEEPLPPLPPKRIRKTPSMPTLARAVSAQTLSERQPSSPPQKNLPTLPSTIGQSTGTPRPSKPGLFSKLFSRKPRRDEEREVAVATSLRASTTSLPESARATVPAVRGSTELEGDVTPPYDDADIKRKRQRTSPEERILKHMQEKCDKPSDKLNQISQYNPNRVKTEPKEPLSPFGGAMANVASPPMYQLGNSLNPGGLRPVLSPRRTPSPMEYTLSNASQAQPQPQQNLACQLQPIIAPQSSPSPIMMQDSMVRNNQLDNNYQLADVGGISNAIGNALNIGNIPDNSQSQPEYIDMSFPQFDNVDLNNLSISDIVKEGINGDASATNDESNQLDSFTRMCILQNLYKSTSD